MALLEGTPDVIAMLTTGSPPNGAWAKWFKARDQNLQREVIAEGYVARANDKAAALETLMTLANPATILAASGYDVGW